MSGAAREKLPAVDLEERSREGVKNAEGAYERVSEIAGAARASSEPSSERKLSSGGEIRRDPQIVRKTNLLALTRLEAPAKGRGKGFAVVARGSRTGEAKSRFPQAHAALWQR